jgi:hypothetical protein
MARGAVSREINCPQDKKVSTPSSRPSVVLREGVTPGRSIISHYVHANSTLTLSTSSLRPSSYHGRVRVGARLAVVQVLLARTVLQAPPWLHHEALQAWEALDVAAARGSAVLSVAVQLWRVLMEA